MIYIDDVLMFGGTFEELERLEEVLSRLRTANLKLSPKKSILFQHEVQFLGHVVGRDGGPTDPEKVVAMTGWPVPTSMVEMRSFLCLCTYYRCFVRGFTTIAARLHQMTRKRAQFHKV